MGKIGKNLSSSRIIILGFAGAVLLGSLLLMLPFATREGEGASFADAVFTAVSAVCVTGLVVHGCLLVCFRAGRHTPANTDRGHGCSDGCRGSLCGIGKADQLKRAQYHAGGYFCQSGGGDCEADGFYHQSRRLF